MYRLLKLKEPKCIKYHQLHILAIVQIIMVHMLMKAKRSVSNGPSFSQPHVRIPSHFPLSQPNPAKISSRPWAPPLAPMALRCSSHLTGATPHSLLRVTVSPAARSSSSARMPYLPPLPGQLQIRPASSSCPAALISMLEEGFGFGGRDLKEMADGGGGGGWRGHVAGVPTARYWWMAGGEG